MLIFQYNIYNEYEKNVSKTKMNKMINDKLKDNKTKKMSSNQMINFFKQHPNWKNKSKNMKKMEMKKVNDKYVFQIKYNDNTYKNIKHQDVINNIYNINIKNKNR